MSRSNSFLKLIKQKKLRLLSFFCFCIILLLTVPTIVYFKYFSNSGREVISPSEVRNIIPYLRNGDIVMRSGIGLWSELFRGYNERDKRFSHVGIVMERRGKFFVLHAEADDITIRGDVHLIPVEEFIGASSGVGVSRLHTLDSNFFAEKALEFLGRKFDWKFNRRESVRLYCTELVDIALRSVPGGEKGLIVGKNDIIPVDSCLDPCYFAEVPLPE